MGLMLVDDLLYIPLTIWELSLLVTLVGSVTKFTTSVANDLLGEACGDSWWKVGRILWLLVFVLLLVWVPGFVELVCAQTIDCFGRVLGVHVVRVWFRCVIGVPLGEHRTASFTVGVLDDDVGAQALVHCFLVFLSVLCQDDGLVRLGLFDIVVDDGGAHVGFEFVSNLLLELDVV